MVTTCLRLKLDRDLPVPLGAQLRGVLEYGIACGQFRPGDRLPSVRDLAEDLGVAPMTVAQVYRDLKETGLIEARAGSGTFVGVCRDSAAHATMAAFRHKVDALVTAGLALGLKGSDIAGLVAARLSAQRGTGADRRVVLVGLFAGATADYARALEQALGPAVRVVPTTVDALENQPGALAGAGAADLVLTFAHRRHAVAALLPQARVEAISFIPAESTRRALASLDPRARVLALSRFPAFLPVMRAGVGRFAPHVARIDAAVLDDPALDSQLGGQDVVVYATGAEAVLSRLGPGVSAIEYRHSPDPGDIDRIVRPLLGIAESAQAARKEAR